MLNRLGLALLGLQLSLGGWEDERASGANAAIDMPIVIEKEVIYIERGYSQVPIY